MENNDEELRKQKEEEAGQKLAHVAGKAVATYYGGALGNKIANEASKAEFGQKLEKSVGKQLNNAPLAKQVNRGLNESGVLDKADQAVDAYASSKGGASTGDAAKVGGELAKDAAVEKSSAENLGNGASGSKGGLFDSFFGGDSNSNNSGNDISDKIKKKLIIKILIPVISFFLIILALLAVITALYYPIEAAINYVKGVWNNIVDIFTKDQEELEKEYYKELESIQNTIKYDHNICIDINLITATLTVNRSFEDIINEDQGDLTDVDDQGNEIPYKKMKKQVKLLANMQLMRKNYGLDKGLYDDTGSYCIEEGSSYQQYELINSENLHNYEKDNIFSENGLDSSTYELIAKHDLSPFGKFFTKKSNEERNYAYYFYRPYFDADGDCDDDLPDEDVEISIGDYETRKESVYYWNLVNSFIPDYYDKSLSDDKTVREDQIRQIADDIYLLYNEVGPSQTCYVNSSYICRNDEGAGFYGGGDKKLTIEEFTQNVSPIAIEEMTRTGIFSSITLSQAALESANGASGLSKNYSNYYGMTAGSCAPSQSPDTVTGSVLQPGENGNDCTGNQFWNGSIVALCNSQGEDCQWYRIYDSFANSTRDHSRLLAQSYGCNVYNTYSEQLDCLVAHGYATDPKYKEKIMNVIGNNNLDSYDIGTFSGTYQDVSENSFVNSMCYGDGVVTYAGEFTSWKQYDSRWKSVKLGTSTVGKIGCAMTSVTIQILRAGVDNILGANLNPGTFATTLTDLGGFTPGGGIYWASAAKIAPNFQFVDAIRRYAAPSEIAEKVNQGYFVILNVKNGRHWVAVDRVEGDKIYMFDPGSGGNEVGHTYGLNSIVGYVYYRRG